MGPGVTVNPEGVAVGPGGETIQDVDDVFQEDICDVCGLTMKKKK